MLSREQLELVVQKKKIDEVHRWFKNHFVDISDEEYVAKCPFVIVQGPPGCGKTSTLKYVANQLGIPVTDFCETTETVYIDEDLNQSSIFRDQEDRSMCRKKAARFEKFVDTKLRFVPLPDPRPDPNPIAPCADSEFESDSDDGIPRSICTLPVPKPVDQRARGVIVHVESSLTFAKSQKLLISTMKSIIKHIKRSAAKNPRRAAIVFENFDSEQEVISLPAKFKQSIGLQVIKFNPIIKANMKKFVELKLRDYKNLPFDKNVIEAIVNDADGDLSACLNSLQVMTSKIPNHLDIFTGLNDDDDISASLNNCRVNKRQRMNPERYTFNLNLVRNVTQSCNFFHLLGKIFYQKRLYPDRHMTSRHKSLERPYALENTTEFLAGRLSIEPKTLLAWLHQHYHKFCGANIDKAALFLSYLSDTDTISTDAMQSTQFYELHSILDQQQLNLALEFTTFSLYEDKSAQTKASNKKVQVKGNSYIVKSSVENSSSNGNGELYAFNKPDCMSVRRVIEDRQIILKYLLEKVLADKLNCTDPTKILVDYLPYVSIMSDVLDSNRNQNETKSLVDSITSNIETLKLIKLLESLEFSKPDMDGFEKQHEKLWEIVERIEEETSIKTDEGEEAGAEKNGAQR